MNFNMKFDYLAIETAIGYKFADKKLLLEAFTHRSFSHEHAGYPSYERLEFMGDSIIGFFVADHLFRSDGDAEGELTKKKIGIVSSIPLASVLCGMGLDKYILFGNGVDPTNKKFCEDVFEALTAAVYLDGGIQSAWSFISGALIDSPYLDESAKLSRDYKSLIKIYFDKAKLGEISYRVIERSGPDHKPTFLVALVAGEAEVSRGEGTSKQKAEQDAARNAVYKLKSEGHNIEL